MTAGLASRRPQWPPTIADSTANKRGNTSRGLAPTSLGRQFHWPLAAVTLALTTFGIVMVFSAGRGPTGDTSFGTRQFVFACGGIVGMACMSVFDYRRLTRLYPYLLGGAFTLLVAVLTPLGTEVRGTQGWFRFGSVALQPSEFTKLAVITGLAVILQGSVRMSGRVRAVLNETAPIDTERPGLGSDIRSFGLSITLLGVAAGLVLLEGETGTVLVYCAIALGMMVTGGTPVRYLLLLVCSGVGVIGLALSAGVLAQYQVARFEAFLNPELDPLGVGYNQQQAITAIGSGGFRGAGLFDGPQTQLGYLPDQHTDFIFAAVSEELGFLGAGLLLIMQATLLGFVFLVGHNCRDRFGTLLCSGVFAMLAFQVFQNVAMNLRVMPITGISLPFMSYGGSSLVTSLLAIGLVQSVAVHSSARHRN
jgi:rod shape determining protein RodA